MEPAYDRAAGRESSPRLSPGRCAGKLNLHPQRRRVRLGIRDLPPIWTLWPSKSGPLNEVEYTQTMPHRNVAGPVLIRLRSAPIAGCNEISRAQARRHVALGPFTRGASSN